MTNVFTAGHSEKIYLSKIGQTDAVAAFMAERDKDANARAHKWESREGGGKEAGMWHECGRRGN